MDKALGRSQKGHEYQERYPRQAPPSAASCTSVHLRCVPTPPTNPPAPAGPPTPPAIHLSCPRRRPPRDTHPLLGIVHQNGLGPRRLWQGNNMFDSVIQVALLVLAPSLLCSPECNTKDAGRGRGCGPRARAQSVIRSYETGIARGHPCLAPADGTRRGRVLQRPEPRRCHAIRWVYRSLCVALDRH